jgi:hypothetical protein
MMRQCYQRGCLRYAKRKSGSDCWEFLWRETDATGKRVRRTAFIGTVDEHPTKELAQEAANGLRMRVNEDRNRERGEISSSRIWWIIIGIQNSVMRLIGILLQQRLSIVLT